MDKQDEILRELRALTKAVAGLTSILIGRPGRGVVSGRVTPPADFTQALAALSPEAREHVDVLRGDGPVTADHIAQAADWEREQRVN